MAYQLKSNKRYALATEARTSGDAQTLKTRAHMDDLTNAFRRALGREGITIRLGLYEITQGIGEFQALSQNVDSEKFESVLKKIADEARTDFFVAESLPSRIFGDTPQRIKAEAVLKTK